MSKLRSRKHSTILITGHDGFIGKTAVAFFLAQGYNVYILSSRLAYNVKTENWVRKLDHPHTLCPNVEFDIILHLATRNHNLYDPKNRMSVMLQNLDADMAIFNYWRWLQPRAKFLGVSTHLAYDKTIGGAIYETDALRGEAPHPEYAMSKIFLHRAVENSKVHNLRGTIFTLGNVFGPYDNFCNDGGIISSTIGKAHDKETVHLHTTGLEQRTFLHVQDVLAAIYEFQDDDQTLIHIPGHDTTVKEVVHSICQHFGTSYTLGQKTVNSRLIKSRFMDTTVDPSLFQIQLNDTIAWYEDSQ